jgi:uncharacterized protein
MIELKVAEIRVADDETPPVVVLAEESGQHRMLPIWMTHAGAAAIMGATEEADSRRSIHDLAVMIVNELADSELTAVEIVGCDAGQYFADLVFVERRLAARPSDAIALALRVGCPIHCAESVLDEYGVTADEIDTAAPVQAEAEVERFLEFLDSVTPEDFSGEGGDEKPLGSGSDS